MRAAASTQSQPRPYFEAPGLVHLAAAPAAERSPRLKDGPAVRLVQAMVSRSGAWWSTVALRVTLAGRRRGRPVPDRRSPATDGSGAGALRSRREKSRDAPEQFIGSARVRRRRCRRRSHEGATAGQPLSEVDSTRAHEAPYAVGVVWIPPEQPECQTRIRRLSRVPTSSMEVVRRRWYDRIASNAQRYGARPARFWSRTRWVAETGEHSSPCSRNVPAPGQAAAMANSTAKASGDRIYAREA